MNMETAKREQLKRKIRNYAKRLKKTNPKMAQKILDHIGDIVEFYEKNNRDMTPKEFHEILER